MSINVMASLQHLWPFKTRPSVRPSMHPSMHPSFRCSSMSRGAESLNIFLYSSDKCEFTPEGTPLIHRRAGKKLFNHAARGSLAFKSGLSFCLIAVSAHPPELCNKERWRSEQVSSAALLLSLDQEVPGAFGNALPPVFQTETASWMITASSQQVSLAALATSAVFRLFPH